MDIGFYENMVPSTNATKPKFMAFLEAVLEHGVLVGSVADSGIYSAYDLENATGEQLDVIGSLVGISRILPYTPATGTRDMDDDEYRTAIRMKIARNTWDGSNESAKNVYDSILGGIVTVVFTDNQDMSVSVYIYGSLSTREAEILNSTGILLIPAGVSYTIETISGDAETQVNVGAAVTGLEIYDEVTVY